MSLIAPKGRPVFVLQRGYSILEDIVEGIFGIAYDQRLLGDATDVVGDVGDGDDDKDGYLPGGQMAPKCVAISVDQRRYDRWSHDRRCTAKTFGRRCCASKILVL